MQKKVSLITGCFNGEKFIDRCFSSILSQTYDSLEVIFVDDGSKDNSLQLAESYRDKFAERGYAFIVISQKNMGFYPQSGIKVCKGKYITTLDIDDVLLPESIEKRATFLEKNPDHSAVRTSGYIVHEDGLRPPVIFTKPDESSGYNVFEDLIFARTNNWPGTYMVRAEVLFEYYPNKILPMTRLTQNLQILLPVTYGRKVGFINEPLMHYMRHDEQTTSDKNNYHTNKRQFQTFKAVRRRILRQMNLLTVEIEDKLDKRYNSVFLGIAFKFKNNKEFNHFYRTIENPTLTEKMMEASINNKEVRYFFLKSLAFLKNKFHSV